MKYSKPLFLFLLVIILTIIMQSCFTMSGVVEIPGKSPFALLKKINGENISHLAKLSDNQSVLLKTFDDEYHFEIYDSKFRRILDSFKISSEDKLINLGTFSYQDNIIVVDQHFDDENVYVTRHIFNQKTKKVNSKEICKISLDSINMLPNGAEVKIEISTDKSHFAVHSTINDGSFFDNLFSEEFLRPEDQTKNVWIFESTGKLIKKYWETYNSDNGFAFLDIVTDDNGDCYIASIKFEMDNYFMYVKQIGRKEKVLSHKFPGEFNGYQLKFTVFTKLDLTNDDYINIYFDLFYWDELYGIGLVSLDFNKGESINSNFFKITEKMAEELMDDDELEYFHLLQTHTFSNGDIMLLYEQMNLEKQTTSTTNSQGNTINVTKYHYGLGNILAFKFDKNFDPISQKNILDKRYSEYSGKPEKMFTPHKKNYFPMCTKCFFEGNTIHFIAMNKGDGWGTYWSKYNLETEEGTKLQKFVSFNGVSYVFPLWTEWMKNSRLIVKGREGSIFSPLTPSLIFRIKDY